MLLIDTYNVLLTTGILPPRLAGLEVDGLVRLLGISRYARERIVLACDGDAPQRGLIGTASARSLASVAGASASAGLADLRVMYAGRERDADSLIEEFLERDSAARRWTVISNDHRVRRAADRAGASSLGSDAFLRQLVFDESRPLAVASPTLRQTIPLGREDVAHWLREFGIPPTELASMSGARSVVDDNTAKRKTAEKGGGKAGGKGSAEPPRQAHSVTPRAKPEPAKPIPGKKQVEVDEVLRNLLREIPGAIRLEDLDMDRWLGTGPDRES